MTVRPPRRGAWCKSSDICLPAEGSPAPVRTPTHPPRLFSVVGAIGGAAGALLGGGTGTVTVPALDRLTTMPRATIHGTATIPNIAVAAVGSAVFLLRGGALDVGVGIPLMIGGVLGVRLGAGFVARVSAETLRAVFVSVLALAGAKLFLDALNLDPIGTHAFLPGAVRDGIAAASLAACLGVVVGAWSASLGSGGGVLTVPALVLLFGTGLHVAEGTSLLVMLPNSILGARAHLAQHTASIPVGARLALGAVPGAAAGALLALALPARTLGLVCGGFVLTMAAREVLGIRDRESTG
jgi:uncharacterized membrane protein YfcA